jgi:hypothetical protein
MSLWNDKGSIAILGKVVETADADVDSHGCGRILITFTDRTVLEIREISQVGEIEYILAPAPHG